MIRGRRAAAAALAALLVGGCSSSEPGRGRQVTVAGRTATAVSTPAPSASTFAAATSAAGVTTASVPAVTAPSTPTTAASAGPIRTATATSTAGVRYPVSLWVEDDVSDCAAHAHGAPIVAYLTEHPCAGMNRQLLTTTVGRRPVGVTVETISFTGGVPTSYDLAGGFQSLVSRDGTGDLADLLSAGARFPGCPAAIPADVAFSALAEDATVAVYQAWYLTGSTPDNDPALVAMEQSIFKQI